MADTTTGIYYERMPEALPSWADVPIAANTLIIEGTITCGDANGRAVPGAAAGGLPAIGIASGTYDNRTGSEAGGAAGALSARVESGTFWVAYTGTVPKVRQVVYIADNQTATLTASTNGVLGVCRGAPRSTDSKIPVTIDPALNGLFTDCLAAAKAYADSLGV